MFPHNFKAPSTRDLKFSEAVDSISFEDLPYFLNDYQWEIVINYAAREKNSKYCLPKWSAQSKNKGRLNSGPAERSKKLCRSRSFIT